MVGLLARVCACVRAVEITLEIFTHIYINGLGEKKKINGALEADFYVHIRKHRKAVTRSKR